ncbi:MAG TPA: exodeoxyribonuclease VII large subunit [Candidatus Dormibacteraeota bacterium]
MERAYSVTEVTALVRDAVAARPELEDLLVEGEISNLTVSVAGHVYFTLKDREASLGCVVWRSNAARIPFRPENGMTLLAHGAVQVYPQGGRYQLYADRLEPSGVGALALAVEQLKRRLAAEGVFDERSKRPLPVLPRRVVVVTSRTGAALRDVHTVMTRRAPGVDLVLSPATVQGEGAAETIVRALHRAGSVRGADVVLMVRGGGSIEDLMAFNSEEVARAIRAAPLPVVTGIGHETDTTVADLAADRRAATPSAAAEVVVPSVLALRADLGRRGILLGQRVREGLERRRSALSASTARLQSRSPGLVVAGLRQDLDRRAALLRHALLQEVAAKRRALDAASGGLREHQPRHRVTTERARLDGARRRLGSAARRVIELRRPALEGRRARLEALSPRRTLERGYSITLDAGGRALTDSAMTQPGRRLRTVLHRGIVESDVAEVRTER